MFSEIRQIQELSYADGGMTVNGIVVPEQGFNVFASVTQADNIYSLGKYVDAGANDANSAASFVGREWSNLASFDLTLPGGADPADTGAAGTWNPPPAPNWGDSVPLLKLEVRGRAYCATPWWKKCQAAMRIVRTPPAADSYRTRTRQGL